MSSPVPITSGAARTNSGPAVISDFTSMTCSFSGTSGGDTYHSLSVMVGYGDLGFSVAFENQCADSGGGGGSTIPPTGDPPFPPCWPYPVSNIYQRESWSMDMQMIRLDTKEFEFTAYDGDSNLLNLSGATVRFTAKWDYFDDDASAVIKLDNGALTGITITDAANGEGIVSIPKTATSSLPTHRSDLVYDLKVKLSNGKEHTVARGALVVLPNSSPAL